MGSYLNPGNENFYKAVNLEIYVGKTGLIKYTNKVLNTQQQYMTFIISVYLFQTMKCGWNM